REGGLMATYSAATPTRVTLLLAGYFVGHGMSTGTKGETTVAATAAGLVQQPLGQRWLERWQRSSAPGPHGGVLTDEMQQIVRNGEYSYSARRTAEGHSDRCTALALALRAGSSAKPAPMKPRPFDRLRRFCA
ncbi:MAG TPA: MnmC family methyltransferase, partial [Vicinamibacterales bacterium]|nr:MnmC family methyltransferase [Vicinamibacterales bacterium]